MSQDIGMAARKEANMFNTWESTTTALDKLMMENAQMTQHNSSDPTNRD
ncbi:hypothetical protein [Bifidobacterium canis]|nr:hypothetical protein [Bifidobacterium canis]